MTFYVTAVQPLSQDSFLSMYQDAFNQLGINFVPDDMDKGGYLETDSLDDIVKLAVGVRRIVPSVCGIIIDEPYRTRGKECDALITLYDDYIE